MWYVRMNNNKDRQRGQEEERSNDHDDENERKTTTRSRRTIQRPLRRRQRSATTRAMSSSLHAVQLQRLCLFVLLVVSAAIQRHSYFASGAFLSPSDHPQRTRKTFSLAIRPVRHQTTPTSTTATTRLHLNLSSVFFDPTTKTREKQRKALKHEGTRPVVAEKASASSLSEKQKQRTQNNSIPFLIELVPEYAADKTYQDIAAMCIQAFFNDDDGNNNNDSGKNKNSKKLVAPWKAAQLAYLRALQTGDLKVRRHRDKRRNMMFVAQEIIPAAAAAAAAHDAKKPFILPNHEHVYNLPKSSSSNSNFLDGDDASNYVRGDVLGFVEVTQRRYGLPKDYQKSSPSSSSIGIVNGNNNPQQQQSQLPKNIVRPVLTNLSVCREARNLGLGSKLLQVCENEVARRWHMYEIILEVEDDNDSAKRFYEKRGYRRIFDDPTSRKYDVSGLWLREVRCKRNVLRKQLNRSLVLPSSSSNSDDNGSSSFDPILSLFELFRK